MRRARNQMLSADVAVQARPIGKFLAASNSGAQIVTMIKIVAAITTGATRATGGRSKNRFSSPYALACTNSLPMSALKLSNKIATPIAAQKISAVCATFLVATSVSTVAMTGETSRSKVNVIGCKKKTEKMQIAQSDQARPIAVFCTATESEATNASTLAPTKGRTATRTRNTQINDLFATS